MEKYGDDPIKVPRFEESQGFYTTKQRSVMMSKIRGKDTKPELLFRKGLTKLGIKYRINFKGLPGKPDISNKKRKLVVFIDGEFWHGHDWDIKKTKIKSNRDFWIPKIERNMQRDRENNRKLEEMGFKVFRFWEADVKMNLDQCLLQITNYLDSTR